MKCRNNLFNDAFFSLNWTFIKLEIKIKSKTLCGKNKNDLIYHIIVYCFDFIITEPKYLHFQKDFRLLLVCDVIYGNVMFIVESFSFIFFRISA